MELLFCYKDLCLQLFKNYAWLMLPVSELLQDRMLTMVMISQKDRFHGKWGVTPPGYVPLTVDAIRKRVQMVEISGETLTHDV